MNELKKEGIRLYYKILKLHKKKLPDFLRDFGFSLIIFFIKKGGKFVRDEFKLHQTNINESQYKEFYDKWFGTLYYNYFREKYYNDLNLMKSEKDIKNISNSEENFLNPQQKETLDKFKDATKDIYLKKNK